ncbi:DUF1292 domain-containing protein [Paenibacillus tarimensis]
MNHTPHERPQRLNRLEQKFGKEIALLADDGTEETYRIVAEFQLGDIAYAGLQTPAMRKEDEVAFFRISTGDGDELGLESIDDEAEWESVAEAYDDLWFSDEDQP